MIYSQRDSQWANQRLGTHDGWTIGQYGCYVTAQAQVANHFGHIVTPGQLDDIFTDRALYVEGALCWDGMLSRVYPDVQYVTSHHFESVAADLSVLTNTFEDEFILEIDFDHDPNDGIQTHFVRFVSFDGSTLVIDDPWYGTEDNFATHYGTDPATTIVKIVHYRGPSPVPDAVSTPTNPVPSDTPEVPATPVSETPSPAAPEPTPQPEPAAPGTADTSSDSSDLGPNPGDLPTPVLDDPLDPPFNVTPVSDSTLPISDPQPQPSLENTQEPNTSSLTPPLDETHNSGMKHILLQKLLSRKLWIAICSAALFYLHGDTNQALGVILGYLGAQGYADAHGFK